MKKLSLLLIGLLLIPALFLTSCDSGDDPGTTPGATPAFTLMKEYMVQNSLDVNNILTNTDGQKFVVAAPGDGMDVPGFLATYHIMDIRSASDFNSAHVDGAINVAFSDILTEAATATKPILVVCYTGQTACYATALLRLYGYSSTRALKWGMSGWNSSTDSWTGKLGNEANGHNNWSSDIAPSNTVFADPAISSSLTDGEAILKKRVEDIVAAGFGAATISGTDVLNNPGNYFINNYFSDTDYAGFGHVAGALRINPFTLADNSYLSLDPDASTLVTYCYTGQTSAVLSATLRVLGYNAKTMTFGMNGIYNNNPAWSTNQWGGDSNSKNYPVISDN